jgi:hypothetical protein
MDRHIKIVVSLFVMYVKDISDSIHIPTVYSVPFPSQERAVICI